MTTLQRQLAQPREAASLWCASPSGIHPLNYRSSFPVDQISERCGVPAVCLYHDDTDEEYERKLLTFIPSPVSPSPWLLEIFDGRRQANTLAQLLSG
jgi:hypothetical protein